MAKSIRLIIILTSFVIFGCSEPAKDSIKSSVDGSSNLTDQAGSAGVSGSVDSDREFKVLFFGDSITAGYGLSAESEAYPYVFEKLATSNGIPVQVTAAGNSGETTAGGARRIDWVLRTSYDMVVIELGGNDGLRGVSVESMKGNLETIIKTVRSKSPEAEIVIAGMKLPPSLGSSYVKSFESVFADLAAENDLFLIPFILEGVAGDSRLNQYDGIHPTASGHEVIGENVWKQLRPLLK